MSKRKTAVAVLLVALSCSAMAASTNRVCGYKWGEWTRVDSLEGSVTTNAYAMSMGVRNGKLGIAYAANKDQATQYAYGYYSEYAYRPESDRLLRQTVTNEDIPTSITMGTYNTCMHGLQFDSAGTPLFAMVRYGDNASIVTRTAPETYSNDNATNSGASVRYWGAVGNSTFVLDAMDKPHYVWITGGTAVSTQVIYGVKSGGVWSNMVLVADIADTNMHELGRPSLTLDSNDYPHVSYTGPDSYVFHAWQDAGGTNLERLGRTGGSWPPPSSVIAMDTNGHPMVAYLEIYPPGPPTTRIVVEMFNGASWTTNAVISRPGADFGFWGSKLVQDLKLDKAGQPAIVVSYTDHASGAAATFWIDFYTWDGSSWTGGHIGTFPNTPGCGQVSLVFDNAGRPFVGTVMELGGTANKGVYILTTIPPPPAGTIFTVQ